MSSSVPLYQVDAFTAEPFSGNPAAICLFETWLSDELMQRIAAEKNLSETAFLVPEGDDWGLRWFTPACEVDLCGHATLASACVLFEDVEPDAEELAFHTQSGVLTVVRAGDGFALDFPAHPPLPVDEPPEALAKGLGGTPLVVYEAPHTFLALFECEADVAALRPDFDRLLDADGKRVIATAPGDEVDFVSRFFAPSVGVDEDPVTGSAHCALAPFWADRLGRKRLRARQVSQRGGDLVVEDRGRRVSIEGQAVIVIRGELLLP